MVVGVGAGQMSRVDSVHMAVRKAGDRVRGAVLASDAFFPFRDNVDEAAAAGVTAIVQPGGSMRDADSHRRLRRARPGDGLHRRPALPALKPIGGVVTTHRGRKPRCVGAPYQSLPRTSPPAGVRAAFHVRCETLADTDLTLPSPRPTRTALVWPALIVSGLQVPPTPNFGATCGVRHSRALPLFGSGVPRRRVLDAEAGQAGERIRRVLARPVDDRVAGRQVDGRPHVPAGRGRVAAGRVGTQAQVLAEDHRVRRAVGEAGPEGGVGDAVEHHAVGHVARQVPARPRAVRLDGRVGRADVARHPCRRARPVEVPRSTGRPAGCCRGSLAPSTAAGSRRPTTAAGSNCSSARPSRTAAGSRFARCRR